MPDFGPLNEFQAATGGQRIPDIIWGGAILPDEEGKPSLSPSDILCLGDGGMTFANLDAMNGFAAPSLDITPHLCEQPRLSEIVLPNDAGAE